jgi:hypothetical protein
VERTDAQTEDLLRAIFRWHSDLYAVLSDRERFDVADGSFLWRSDELSDGRTTTHLRSTLMAAVDHFAASNALVQGPPPMYATAALIRGCIEASATVVWLLDAETKIEHLERVALLDLKSVRERHEFIGDRDSDAHDRATLVDLAPTVRGSARPALGDIRRCRSARRGPRSKRSTRHSALSQQSSTRRLGALRR